MDKKLREEASMEEKNERKREGGVEIEGKEGEKLNFEVCLTSFSFIKFMIGVTHVSIYSLGN